MDCYKSKPNTKTKLAKSERVEYTSAYPLRGMNTAIVIAHFLYVLKLILTVNRSVFLFSIVVTFSERRSRLRSLTLHCIAIFSLHSLYIAALVPGMSIKCLCEKALDVKCLFELIRRVSIGCSQISFVFCFVLFCLRLCEMGNIFNTSLCQSEYYRACIFLDITLRLLVLAGVSRDGYLFCGDGHVQNRARARGFQTFLSYSCFSSHPP